MTDERSIDEAFFRFHEAHPNVYEGLVKLTRRGKEVGRTRLGIGMLFEVLRWTWILEGLPDEAEEFKLNNNYRSRYARLIMFLEPDLEGMFQVRELKTDSAFAVFDTYLGVDHEH